MLLLRLNFDMLWQYGYFSVVIKTNCIHERALRVANKDNKSSFDERFEKMTPVIFMKQIFQNQLTEIFKIKMNLAPEIMKDVFEIFKLSCSLRNEIKIKSKEIHSVRQTLKQHLLLVLGEALEQFTYNPGQNILKLDNTLVQNRLTTSKRELDIQYNKLDIRVASRVSEPPT